MESLLPFKVSGGAGGLILCYPRYSIGDESQDGPLLCTSPVSVALGCREPGPVTRPDSLMREATERH
jgi:hypothetical protein